MLPYEKIFLKGTGLRKMRTRFLSEVCAYGMCVAIHSNDKSLDLCHLSCLVLRGDTSGLEPPAFLYSLDFLLLFYQEKSKENIINITISSLSIDIIFLQIYLILV
jgi:hypothetical protein